MDHEDNPAPAESVSVTESDVDLLDLEPSSNLPLASTGPWVARCVDPRHPSLIGRICCEIESPGTETVQRWVPTLHGLTVRTGDQVLLSKPANWLEPIVVGVLDGFARRPEQPRTAAAKLVVERDESVLVESQDGQPLVEIRQTDDGPVARLLHEDVHLELRGELRISAKAIALAAREGEARIDAAGDVIVAGETIQLN
ncbi:MAG: hypothetical protein JRI68_16820 [Deltaproteobacteria bacterium]|nr:hypothetical protein [Deltaproteobacteria bacterium]